MKRIRIVIAGGGPIENKANDMKIHRLANLTSVFIDDEECPNVQAVKFEAESGAATLVTVSFYPDSVEVETETE